MPYRSCLTCQILSTRNSCVEFNGNALDDFDTEALQRGDVRGVIGEQANFADSEIREDLAAEADGAQDALRMSGTFAGAVRPIGAATVKGQAAGDAGDSSGRGSFDTEAALGVMQVDEGAAAGCGDLAQ